MLRDLAPAVIIALVAAGLGAIPLILANGSTGAAGTQAGLFATLAHMLLMLVGAAVVVLGHLAVSPMGFAVWLLVFYWTSLAVLVIASIKLVRSSRPEVRPNS